MELSVSSYRKFAAGPQDATRFIWLHRRNDVLELALFGAKPNYRLAFLEILAALLARNNFGIAHTVYINMLCAYGVHAR